MFKKIRNPLCVVMAIAALLFSMAGCTTKPPVKSSSPFNKEIVTIHSIYPGTEPTSLASVLPKINEKMGKDIGVNLALTWSPWDQYSNKVTLAVSSGESIDFIWSSTGSLANYFAQRIIAPIDSSMAKYGSDIYKNIDKKLFDTMKIGGKLYGVPSTGNGPLYATTHVLQYREDLRLKYKLPKLDSIENMETFFKTIQKNEPNLIPLCSNNAAYIIMKDFGPEEYLGNTNGVVSFKINDDKSVDLMLTSDAPAFKGSVAKVREWYNAGYIPKNILNISSTQDKMNAGAAASVGGTALSAAQSQGKISANVPGAALYDQPVFGTYKKYNSGNGGNGLYLTSTSTHSDQVVQFWNWVFTNQSNFDLYNYGVQGTNYTLDSNSRITYLTTDRTTDFTGFTGWMFSNSNYNRYTKGITDDYIKTVKNWDSGATTSPLMGFVFNPKNVKTEMANCKSVFDECIKALNVGIADDAYYKNYVSRMKAAGEDKILAEAQAQVKNFQATGKNS